MLKDEFIFVIRTVLPIVRFLRRFELNVREDSRKFIFFKQLMFENAKHGETEAVEVGPAKGEKVIVEICHKGQGHYVGKEAKDPI